MTMNASNEDIFDKLQDIVRLTASQFYIWRKLQNIDNKQWYEMRGWFRRPILITLQDSYMLNFANIFDMNPNTLTLYSLIKTDDVDAIKKKEIRDKLKSKNEVIEKLRNRRRNYAAHKNIGYTLDLHLLSKDFPLQYWDIEDLLDVIVEILDKIRENFNKYGTSYVNYYKSLKEDCERNTEFVLENGLHTQWYKKAHKLI